MTSDRAARRREIARRLHPDLGGDPEAFVAALAALDAELDERPGSTAVGSTGPAGSAGPSGPVGRPRGRVRRLERRVTGSTTRLVRDLRQRIPRSWPGARRYGRL